MVLQTNGKFVAMIIKTARFLLTKLFKHNKIKKEILMKKNIRRLLALCLTVMLILSVAVVASAASVTFVMDGDTYTAILTCGSANSKEKAISGTDVFYHESGEQTPVYFPGPFTVTHSTSILSVYASYLEDLLEEEGLMLSCTATGRVPDMWYHVDESASTGNYGMGIRFSCYNAPWEVRGGVWTRSVEPAAADAASGTISQAPNGVWTIKTVKVN